MSNSSTIFTSYNLVEKGRLRACIYEKYQIKPFIMIFNDLSFISSLKTFSVRF